LAVVWLFDSDPIRYRTGRLFRRLGASLSYINPFWGIEVLGDPPDDMRAPYVVVSNHLSHADVPIISRLPWEMKWVAKRELFDVPVAGWMLRMARDIAGDRGDKRSRAQVLVRARHVLEANCPVMFFPEGTRSRDGRIHRFAEGPFRLAIREGARILPLAIDGTQDALPKHSWKFSDPGMPMRLKVLSPIDTDGLSSDDARELAEEVRQQIIAEVAAWRNVPTETVDALTARSVAAHTPDSTQTPDGKESVKPPADKSRSEPAS
jgi:1-acyl-sn-glycerol-3-phosphate acyltransferase